MDQDGGAFSIVLLAAVVPPSPDEAPGIPDICHLNHLYIGGEKIGHVEKFQISIHNRCGEIRNFARFGGISKFYT